MVEEGDEVVHDHIRADNRAVKADEYYVSSYHVCGTSLAAADVVEAVDAVAHAAVVSMIVGVAAGFVGVLAVPCYVPETEVGPVVPCWVVCVYVRRRAIPTGGQRRSWRGWWRKGGSGRV